MPAVSLHQPWASLLITRQPCPTFEDDICSNHGMVKRFETRSWPCPPALLGQPIAFHATQRKPVHGTDVGAFRVYGTSTLGDRVTPARMYERRPGWGTRPEIPIPLPLGAIVGSGRITASLPILSGDYEGNRAPPFVVTHDNTLTLYREHPDTWEWIDYDISDQLPYGDYSTDGKQRYAWLIEDAAPTTERCPWCWG
jgi:hypothetical protein